MAAVRTRTIARAALLAFLSLISGGAAAQPGRAAAASLERTLARAERLFASGRLGPAVALWIRAIERSPGDSRAAIALARTLPADPAAAAAAGDELRERARLASSALARSVDAADPAIARAAREPYAWALAVSGDHAGAISRAARDAGLQDRAASDALRRLATVAILRGDRLSARAALGAAVRAMPQLPDVSRELAAVDLSLGLPNAAIDRLARVRAAHPEDADVARDLAGALLAAGEGQRAVALYEELARAHPGDPVFALEHARAALATGDAARALRTVAPHLEGAASAQAQAVRGAALLASDRVAEARAAFREALRREPGLAEAERGLAACER